MLWRSGRIHFLSVCLDSTSTQKMNADHIGEHKLTSPAQSRAALGIFVPFFERTPHCRNPPCSVNRTFLIFSIHGGNDNVI